jgi:uncharacterized protein YkwD/chitodextrinase
MKIVFRVSVLFLIASAFILSPVRMGFAADTPMTQPTLDSEEWGFLTLINNYRAQNGVGPLQVSVDLENSSSWMSNDMATKNYFSHTDSLGRSVGARLFAFGYSYLPWGENLAAGYSDAQDTFNLWETACDPDASGNCTYAHRMNMLSPGYAAIGIARAYESGSTYGWYWTTDFGGVVEQNVPPPTTPAPTIIPTINSFTAAPSSIAAGQFATLSWNVTGAVSLTIDNGIGDVSTAASTAVSPAQTIVYTLTATNSAGSSSSQVTVTVTAAPVTQPPSAPVLNSATAPSSSEADLGWTASVDAVGVSGYQILRNGGVLATVSGTTLSYADTTVSPGATYSYSVRAFDAAGNQSAASNSIQVAIPVAPPSAGSCSPAATGAFLGCYFNNITLSGEPVLVRTDPQINFDWGSTPPNPSLSRRGFSALWQGNFIFAQGLYTFTTVTSDGMRLYIDGNLVLNQWNNQPAATYTVQQAVSQGVHLITLQYYDVTQTSVAHLTWQGTVPVVQLPSIVSFAAAPSAVVAGQPSTLTWRVNGASAIAIDNGVGNVTGVSSIAVLPAQTTAYTLTATNSAGASTSRATVTVGSLQDTHPPTVPVLTSAVANGSTAVDLTWLTSVDNVAVAGYQILKNGNAIGSVSVSTLSYTDTGITPGASYTYSIKAYDAAGNYSAASNAIQVVIPAAPASSGSCAAAVGAFTGCYFSNITLSGEPVLVRTDTQINFDWGGNPPERSVARGYFSVQWQGSFDFSEGAYTFSTLTSDGMRLYIDGNLILDHWNDQAATQYTVSQTVSQGSHVIMVQYFEQTGSSTAHVTWQEN